MCKMCTAHQGAKTYLETDYARPYRRYGCLLSDCGMSGSCRRRNPPAEEHNKSTFLLPRSEKQTTLERKATVSFSILERSFLNKNEIYLSGQKDKTKP